MNKIIGINNWPLALILSVFLLSYFIHPKYPQISTGIRVGNSIKTAKIIANRMHHLPPLEYIEVDPYFDDRGLSYLFAIPYYFNISAIRAPLDHPIPKSIYLFMSLIHLIAFISFYFILKNHLHNFFAVIFSLMILISPQILYAMFSLDIYIFPLYAYIFLYIILRAILLNEPWKFFILSFIGVLGIFFLELIRGSTWLAILGLFSLFFFPHFKKYFSSSLISTKQIRARILFCFLMMGFFLTVKSQLKFAAHPVWHSVFVGTMEFGGYLDPNTNKLYPSFVSQNEIPLNAIYKNNWNDWFGYNYAKSIDPNVQLLSAAYSKIVRKEFFRYCKEYPLGMLTLYSKRFMQLLDWDIWSWKQSDHSKNPNIFFVYIVKLMIISVFIFSLIRSSTRQHALFFLLLFAPLSTGGLLVYSSNAQYLLPFKVCLFLGLLFFIKFSCRNGMPFHHDKLMRRTHGA